MSVELGLSNVRFGLFLASNYAWTELVAQAQLAEATAQVHVVAANDTAGTQQSR